MDTVHDCDRQTDRRTDRVTITKTVQRIASHGNECITIKRTVFILAHDLLKSVFVT